MRVWHSAGVNFSGPRPVNQHQVRVWHLSGILHDLAGNHTYQRVVFVVILAEMVNYVQIYDDQGRFSSCISSVSNNGNALVVSPV